MSQYIENTWLEAHTCGKCGILWAMPSHFIEARRKDRKEFYCPNGHPRVFRTSLEDQLRQQLIDANKRVDTAEQAVVRERTEKARVAKAHNKMRQRIVNGVCPCCNRTFQNLLQHMKTEHPEFAQEKQLRALRTAFGMTQGMLAAEIGVDSSHISLFERGSSVRASAKRAIEGWIESHDMPVTQPEIRHA